MMFFLLAYVSPLVIIALFFISAFFLLDGPAKIILFVFVLWVMFLPFVMLYKEEVIEYRKRQDS